MSNYARESVSSTIDPDRLAATLEALANRNRLAIFEFLRRRGFSLTGSSDRPSVGEIAAEFDLALSTVSHHLKELHRSGLIICRREGKNVFCEVNPQALRALRDYFGS